MSITFKFVNRFDLFTQAKIIIDNIKNLSGVVEPNLYGYWGTPGIGKTSLLDAIYSYIKKSGINNYFKYDCKEDKDVDPFINFLNQNSNEAGIALIDHLEELMHNKFELILEACDSFIRKNIKWRIIFCTSRRPDSILRLLRPEQRLVISLPELDPDGTRQMLDQIYPDMSADDKDFLDEYAVGYPQMMTSFCSIIQEKKYVKKIPNKKLFLWKSLEDLMNQAFLLKIPEDVIRLCYLSLLEGFLIDSGKQLLNYIAFKFNLSNLPFDRFSDFQIFTQTCMNYSILSWAKNDYIFYRPLQILLRKYMSDFEQEPYLKTYEWLVDHYTTKYINACGKDKGHYLLKLTFYRYRVFNLTKEDILNYLSNEIINLEKENNVDAIEIVNQEIKNSEIGKIFNINSISEIRK